MWSITSAKGCTAHIQNPENFSLTMLSNVQNVLVFSLNVISPTLFIQSSYKMMAPAGVLVCW